MTLKIVVDEQSCHFGQKLDAILLTVIIFSAWDKSRDQEAIWSKLEPM